MPPKASWKELAPPESMQQKMGYLRACQDWFWQLDESERPASRLVLGAVPTAPRPGGAPPPTADSWFRADFGSAAVGAGYVAQCGACEQRLPAEETVPCAVCPFARIFALRCRACAAGAD